MRDDFAVFILTHERASRVITYDTLKRSGYTGKIFLVIDDQDNQKKEYMGAFGKKNVIQFSKSEIAKGFDEADNFGTKKAIVYARNACFPIAKSLGIKYFLQLDDDYQQFQFRFNGEFCYQPKSLKKLDPIFEAMTKYLESSGIASIAFSQGGDFIGGEGNRNAKTIRSNRKCMNSFFCCTNRPFQFIGAINEDVNTYTHKGSLGAVFLTTTQISLEQLATQSNPGGMTTEYLKDGTYVKSFYSILFQPSSIKIFALKDRLQSRMHHKVSWDKTVPKIIREEHRKKA